MIGGKLAYNFLLHDCLCDGEDTPFNGHVTSEQDNLALLIAIDGYGENTSHRGGYPILLEKHEGRLRLLIWADINQEDPTHIIDLEGAKETNRKG